MRHHSRASATPVCLWANWSLPVCASLCAKPRRVHTDLLRAKQFRPASAYLVHGLRNNVFLSPVRQLHTCRAQGVPAPSGEQRCSECHVAAIRQRRHHQASVVALVLVAVQEDRQHLQSTPTPMRSTDGGSLVSDGRTDIATAVLTRS